ncbi:hypothetical protein LEMLEM_LOCUS7393, partial [Lemmus lemmus]
PPSLTWLCLELGRNHWAQLNRIREAPALCVATDSAAASLIPPSLLLEHNRTCTERAVPQVGVPVCEAPAQCQAHCSCSINALLLSLQVGSWSLLAMVVLAELSYLLLGVYERL